MCWQDVQIGRSTTLRSNKSRANSDSAIQSYNAWPNRTRFIITTNNSGGVAPVLNQVRVALGTGGGSSNYVIFDGNSSAPIVIDYEQYGNCVQGGITIYADFGTAQNDWCITEFELVDPGRRGEPATGTPGG